MNSRPLRVAHVLGSLGYGGVETWLMNVLRKLDRQHVAIDVVTTKADLGHYAPEAERLGCTVISCPLRPQVWSYGRRLEAIIRSRPYDIVHAHVYLFSGYVLRVAGRAGVPLRIAHVYPTADLRPQTLRRKTYRFLMARWLNRYGNCFLADSHAALESFWAGWPDDGNPRHVLYCGIDLKPYTTGLPRDRCRQELGLPLDRPVIINVGRVVPHKNQGALVTIAESVLREFPDALFVMAGDGPLLPEIRRRVSERDLDNSFRFLQGVSDLIPLWKAADVFVFPTLMEGFGIVVVEAAACGLPVVASDVPGVREAAQACAAVTLVPPWDINAMAMATVRYLKDRRRYPPDPQRLAPFSIETSVASLAQIYSDSMRRIARVEGA